MTGWQSDYTASAPSVNQEAMELTRTVSHLAAANQQLASAHSALLTQLEKLYAELNKAREEKENLKTEVSHVDGCSQTELNNQLLSRIEAIENFIKNFGATGDLRCCKNLHREKDENDKRECQKAIDRIQLMENVLEPEKYESEVERQKKRFENLKRDYDVRSFF